MGKIGRDMIGWREWGRGIGIEIGMGEV